VNKKELTEQEIRTRIITPAIQKAGWELVQIRENYSITKGRIIARGGICKRDEAKFADYVLFYKPHIPLAIVEAKNNNCSIGHGMQQALVNENSDLVNQDDRYVMRITGDDEVGKKQLDNFRDVNATYPVLITLPNMANRQQPSCKHYWKNMPTRE